MRSSLFLLTCMLAFTSPLYASGDPSLATYYVGFEGNVPPRNGSDGLPYPDNPNANRLTMLFAHSYIGDVYPTKTINHYHPLGAYRYTGPSTSPNVTYSNARTPEGTRDPLTLRSGSGPFAGKYISNLGSPTSSDYASLTIRSIESLRAGAGPSGTAPATQFSYGNLNPAAATYDAAWQDYLSTASGSWLMLNSSPLSTKLLVEM